MSQPQNRTVAPKGTIRTRRPIRGLPPQPDAERARYGLIRKWGLAMESPEEHGLTREEDDSLRRLFWFAETVGVSQWARNRIEDLRRRDRRAEIRPPRDEVIAACAADILQRADALALPGDAVLGIRRADGPEASAELNHGIAETLSITAVRQNRRRRHPWSLRKGAKGS